MSSEKLSKGDQCSYISKTSLLLRNHKKKKHESIHPLDANDTIENKDALESESSGNNSNSESDYDLQAEEFTCCGERLGTENVSSHF